MSTLNDRLDVLQREKTLAYDERDEIVKKQYVENVKRKNAEKEVKMIFFLKIFFSMIFKVI